MRSLDAKQGDLFPWEPCAPSGAGADPHWKLSINREFFFVDGIGSTGGMEIVCGGDGCRCSLPIEEAGQWAKALYQCCVVEGLTIPIGDTFLEDWYKDLRRFV